MARAFSLVLMACAACSPATTDGGPSRCRRLEVTVDGESVDMPKGLGVSVGEARGGGFVVSRFDRATTECAAYVKLTSEIHPDELEVAAYVGPVVTNVRANTSSSLGAKAYLVETPRKIGDTLSACVPEPVQHDVELDGRIVTVTIVGLISGTFCGDQAQD